MDVKASRQAGRQVGTQAEEMKREKRRYNIACNTLESVSYSPREKFSHCTGDEKQLPGTATFGALQLGKS